MKIKKVIIPVMSIIIMTSQMTGCAAVNSREMVKMIDAGQNITIEVAKPSYDISIKGKQGGKMEWI